MTIDSTKVIFGGLYIQGITFPTHLKPLYLLGPYLAARRNMLHPSVRVVISHRMKLTTWELGYKDV